MAWRKVGPWTLTMLALMVELQAPLAAQDSAPGMLPGMGIVMPETQQFLDAQSAANDHVAPNSETSVSFIDSALPQSQVRILIDGNYDLRQPDRAEYLFAKSGAPGSPGWALPERRVDWQDVTSYLEIAWQNTLSGFVQAPVRFVNPDINSNSWGLGDIDLGFKWAFVSIPGLISTLQLRGTIPTDTGPGLSTYHYSIEPALLLNFRPISWLAVESELRYWKPIGGTDFAGDMIRYGVGLTFCERSYDNFWFTPVLELIGWSILGGQETVFSAPDTGIARSASGETIVEGIAGVRFGFGDQGDIYVGYGRALTGDAWQRQLWRVEFRVRF